MAKLNLYLGEVIIGIIIGGMSLWFVIQSLMLPLQGSNSSFGAGSFPLIISSTCFILSLALVIWGLYRYLKAEKVNIEFNHFSKTILLMLTFAGFIFLMPILSFYICSLLFIPLLLLIAKEKNWKNIAMITVGFLIFSWAGFEMMLGVPLP